MNIYAKQGHRVVFDNPSNGYDFDQDLARKHLKVGEIYTVVKTEVRDWSTTIWLSEVPNVGFNSVLFSDVT